MIRQMKHPEHEINIGVVGKYIKHHDAYKSIYESLEHAGIASRSRIILRKIDAENVSEDGIERALGGLDGILVPGGFGERGIAGKIDAIRFAREKNIPFFGICLGLQCAVIEFARNVLGLENANSTEMDSSCADPVVCLMDAQYKVVEKGGTMRLGAYPCKLLAGSKVHAAYGTDMIEERHRHRYEMNNKYRELFQTAGLLVSGTSPGGELVEIVELKNHPWFVAVQCHPEFKSKPTKAHPLFKAFIEASLRRRSARSIE